MATVSTLVNDIITDIPEVPGFVAERQYLRALRELCEKARVWRADIQITSIVGIPTISLTSYLPSGTELVDIISFKPSDGSASVKPKTQAWLDINETDWRDQTSNIATWYVLNSNNTIRFVPKPAANTVYYLRVAVKPVLTATTISDLVVNKYSELLISGAKAFLFMTPRKPWTDLNLAQYHKAVFEAGIPDARSEAADEFQTGVARKVKYGGI